MNIIERMKNNLEFNGFELQTTNRYYHEDHDATIEIIEDQKLFKLEFNNEVIFSNDLTECYEIIEDELELDFGFEYFITD